MHITLKFLLLPIVNVNEKLKEGTLQSFHIKSYGLKNLIQELENNGKILREEIGFNNNHLFFISISFALKMIESSNNTYEMIEFEEIVNNYFGFTLTEICHRLLY